jgi:hypothetical protein
MPAATWMVENPTKSNYRVFVWDIRTKEKGKKEQCMRISIEGVCDENLEP